MFKKLLNISKSNNKVKAAPTVREVQEAVQPKVVIGQASQQVAGKAGLESVKEQVKIRNARHGDIERTESEIKLLGIWNETEIEEDDKEITTLLPRGIDPDMMANLSRQYFLNTRPENAEAARLPPFVPGMTTSDEDNLKLLPSATEEEARHHLTKKKTQKQIDEEKRYREEAWQAKLKEIAELKINEAETKAKKEAEKEAKRTESVFNKLEESGKATADELKELKEKAKKKESVKPPEVLPLKSALKPVEPPKPIVPLKKDEKPKPVVVPLKPIEKPKPVVPLKKDEKPKPVVVPLKPIEKPKPIELLNPKEKPKPVVPIKPGDKTGSGDAAAAGAKKPLLPAGKVTKAITKAVQKQKKGKNVVSSSSSSSDEDDMFAQYAQYAAMMGMGGYGGYPGGIGGYPGGFGGYPGYGAPQPRTYQALSAQMRGFQVPNPGACEPQQPIPKPKIDCKARPKKINNDGLDFEFRPSSACGMEVTITIEPDEPDPIEFALDNGISPIVCCMMPPCLMVAPPNYQSQYQQQQQRNGFQSNQNYNNQNQSSSQTFSGGFQVNRPEYQQLNFHNSNGSFGSNYK